MAKLRAMGEIAASLAQLEQVQKQERAGLFRQAEIKRASNHATCDDTWLDAIVRDGGPR